MQFKTVNSETNIAEVSADVLLVGCFEDDPAPTIYAVDTACGGAIARQAKAAKFAGKSGQAQLCFTDGKIETEWVLLFGLGKREKFNATTLQKSLTAAFKEAKSQGYKKVALAPIPLMSVTPKVYGEIIAKYAGLVDYVPNHSKTEKGGHKKEARLKQVEVLGQYDGVKQGLSEGHVIADAVNYARDLCNLSGSELNPDEFVKEAQKVAKESHGKIKCQVYNHQQLAKMGANAILAVGQGSKHKPRLIKLTYGNGKPDICLIGKTITMDTGGHDLKLSGGMLTMKQDMSGGADVLAAIKAIAALDLPCAVTVYMAPASNMIGPDAYLPGDIIKTMNGRTVYVENTDAEGRLTLIDVIELAQRQGAKKMIELSTLTGASQFVTGDSAAVLFSNDKELCNQVLQAAEETGEQVQPLTMWPEIGQANKCDMADLKNTGTPNKAGATTAAMFIMEFVHEGNCLAHLDIAPVAYRNSPRGIDPQGGTGWGVRMLIQYAKNQCNKKSNGA